MATDQSSETELLPLPEIARLLGVTIVGVHQLIKDGQLVAVADSEGRRAIPRGCIAQGGVVKSLPAVIRLLRDAGYQDSEVIDWLCRPDDTLAGTPLTALAANRGTEIKRRAQAAGF